MENDEKTNIFHLCMCNPYPTFEIFIAKTRSNILSKSIKTSVSIFQDFLYERL